MLNAPVKPKNSGRVLMIILFLVIGFGLGAAVTRQTNSGFPTKIAGTWNNIRQALWQPMAVLTDSPPATTVQPVTVVLEESQVINVVKNASPAVVSIVVSANVPNMEICYTNPFGDQFQGLPGSPSIDFRVPTYCQNGTTRQRVGAGSGYLVSPDGYILTNKHVVDDTQADYTVILNDAAHRNQQVPAKVLAKDPTNDIAVLKIEMTGLPYLQFGDSSQLQVGQTAIAIGYALGEFDNTVSKGVVSGLRRSIQAGGFGTQSEQLNDVIQTDAAINPGNSGGPLLDIAGNVIGMNVAMAQAQSISFAIPSNAVNEVYQQVRQNGKIVRPFMGVRYLPITQAVKDANKLSVDYGALIIRGQQSGELAVVPGSPADLAGILENDIILEVNGTKIQEPDSGLSQLIGKYQPGDTLQLKVLRQGKTIDLSVKLGSQ
ncbi:MAG: trypsin-like peptidase domain-containing protein [Patescibacteria group bacterium]|nr:trypsin-like peptidase domain-containing protein [Patescibacteria group bacterium]